MGEAQRRTREQHRHRSDQTANRRRARQLVEDRIDGALPVAAAGATLVMLGAVGAMAFAGGALATILGGMRSRPARRRLAPAVELA